MTEHHKKMSFIGVVLDNTCGASLTSVLNYLDVFICWCGTRKFHPRTRIFFSETNYSDPLMEFPCPTPIHIKDSLNLIHKASKNLHIWYND